MGNGITESEACKNCGALLPGRFCADCGQQKRPLNQSLSEILAELWQELSYTDGRTLSTLKRLFAAPGYLTREYLEGRRARWLPPIRMYLIVSLIYFTTGSLTGQSGPTLDISVTGETDEDAVAELQSYGYANEAELEEAINDAEAEWMPRAMFVLVPLFAALVQAAQRGSELHYPQHLIFSLHVHTAWFVVFSAFALLEYPLDSDFLKGTLSLIALLYALIYLVLSFKRVYGGTNSRAIGRGLAVGVSYAILTLLITSVIVVSIIL